MMLRCYHYFFRYKAPVVCPKLIQWDNPHKPHISLLSYRSLSANPYYDTVTRLLFLTLASLHLSLLSFLPAQEILKGTVSESFAVNLIRFCLLFFEK